jgi:hypothetical protein
VRIPAGRSRLDKYPLQIADGAAHVEAGARALSTFGCEERMTINKTKSRVTQTPPRFLPKFRAALTSGLGFVNPYPGAHAGREPDAKLAN